MSMCSQIASASGRRGQTWQAQGAAGHRFAPALQPPRRRPRLHHSARCSASPHASTTSTGSSEPTSLPPADVGSDSSSSESSSGSSSSSSSSSSGVAGCTPATPLLSVGSLLPAQSLAVRPAENGDYWAVADLHACAFYPRATPFWFAALRMDRVLSLQVGSERQQGSARFSCLVAQCEPNNPAITGGTSSGSSSWQEASGSSSWQEASGSSNGDGSSSSNTGGGVLAQAATMQAEAEAEAAQAATSNGNSSGSDSSGNRRKEVLRDFHTATGAATDKVDLGPLMGALVHLLFPPAMRQNYAISYNAGGVCGAVVVDTLGDFVPPKRKRMPNGTFREVNRSRVAYLSNLAVAPCMRRTGIGRRLVTEAEQLAAEWGCRSVALHVDPSNTPAVEMYRRAGYRRVSMQPEWQRILEGRSRPLLLMMRVLPGDLRQLAQRRWQQLQQAELEEEQREQLRQQRRQ